MIISNRQLRRLIRESLTLERKGEKIKQQGGEAGEGALDKGGGSSGPGRPGGEYAEASTMSISTDGLNNIKREEGSVSQVYDDKTGNVIDSWDDINNDSGHPTIGVGHLIYRKEDRNSSGAAAKRESGDWSDEKWGDYLEGGSSLSDDDIRTLLSQDIESHTRWKEDITKPITQNMFDAIADFAFNAGNAAPERDGVIGAINDGNYNAAATALRNAPGNPERRRKNAEKFLED
jgi:GH24 family phage-related lysozyme (muramidase)